MLCLKFINKYHYNLHKKILKYLNFDAILAIEISSLISIIMEIRRVGMEARIA